MASPQETAAELRAALLALRNAPAADKAAAKARVTTLGAQTAMTMTGNDRKHFVADLDNDIENAMKA